MRQRAKYGIDAPKAVRRFIIVGILLASPTLKELAWPGSSIVPVPWRIGSDVIAGLLLTYATIMLWSSLVGKMQVRDRLVAALDLSGDAQVLDAGCGRGLALIACAQKLTTGRAVGIDLWAGKDLSKNTPAEARANAVAEGVIDRIGIETGDITRLPFADGTFDAVISMTVIHNIAMQDDRDQAVREFVRVLKPGGRIAIFDLLHTTRYIEILREAGLTVETLDRDLLWLMPCRSLLAWKSLAADSDMASFRYGKAWPVET